MFLISKPIVHLQMYHQCLNVYDVALISLLDLHFAFICLMFDIGESMISSLIHDYCIFVMVKLNASLEQATKA